MFSNFLKHVPGTLAHSMEKERVSRDRRAVSARPRQDAPRSCSIGDTGYSIAAYSDGGYSSSSSSCSSDSGSGGGGGCD